uniref:glutathione transferase n=1 Tax=Salix viminalis TaxID=40686 RepID=A0A6N2K5K0_SALVM
MATPVKVYGPPLSTAVSRVLATLLEKDVPFQIIPVDMSKDKGNKGLYGTNPLEKASIDQWVEAEGQSFGPPSGALVFQLAFAPRMNIPQDQGAIKQNEEKLRKVLDIYERRLGESRFLAGDEFTFADLSHLPNGDYLVNATDKGHLFTSRENLGRWWNEISDRESWKKVVEMRKSS